MAARAFSYWVCAGRVVNMDGTFADNAPCWQPCSPFLDCEKMSTEELEKLACHCPCVTYNCENVAPRDGVG